MNLSDMQNLLRPARESAWQALVPVATVLVSGLVIILAVSPDYLRELHPFTLLLLAVACALPVWAWSQLLWWYTGRVVSAALVAKITYVLDVPETRRAAYAFALSELLKATDFIRFVPHKHIADLVTVITIYVGAALCHLAGVSPAMLYAGILGLGVLVWAAGLFVLRRSVLSVDVEPLREFWQELKTKDDLLANVNRHLERMEKVLSSAVNRSEAVLS
jgi:hypothetical protein